MTRSAGLADGGRDYVLAMARAAALKRSYYHFRAEAMGFRFEAPELEWTALYPDGDGIRLRRAFVCICGRRETVQLLVSAGQLRYARSFDMLELDVARWLTRHGSFSESHLRGDGYTQQQIDEILRKGREFDDAVREFVAPAPMHPEEFEMHTRRRRRDLLIDP